MKKSIVDEKKLMVSNTLALGVASVLRMLIQIGMLPLMAHLVGPNEFGVFALVMPTISFFNLLADGGLGESLARVDESDKRTWSTGFWAILSICTLLCAIIAISGYFISIVSGQERIRLIMIVMSPTFILLALSAVPHARLTRRGLLKIHVLSDLIGISVSSVVAVVLASNGFGVWSLVCQYIFYALCRFTILNSYAFERPDLVFDFSMLKDHLKIGTSMVSGKLLDFTGRIIENSLFGRIFGPSTLGDYSFANQSCRYLVEVFTNPLWGSIYAYALKNNIADATSVYRRTSRVLSYLLIPLAFFGSALAPGLFATIIGPKWELAAEMVQVLVPTYAFAAIAAQSSAIMYANSFSVPAVMPALVYFTLRAFAVSLGSYAGLSNLIWAISALNVMYAVAFYVSLKTVNIGKISLQIRDLVYPTTSALVSLMIFWLLIRYVPLLRVYSDHIYLIVCAFLFLFAVDAVIIYAINSKQVKSDFLSIWRMVRK